MRAAKSLAAWANDQPTLVGIGDNRFHERLADFARALGLDARRFVGGVEFGEEVLGGAHESISFGLALHAVSGSCKGSFYY